VANVKFLVRTKYAIIEEGVDGWDGWGQLVLREGGTTLRFKAEMGDGVEKKYRQREATSQVS